MTRQEFIFSNKPNHRISRHLAFWVFYFFYFWMQSINPSGLEDFSNSDTYKFALYSLYCFVPLCILSTYISLYYLLPAFLHKKKYILFFCSLFLLLLLGAFMNYFLAEIFINNTDYQKISASPLLSILHLSQINLKWAITIALIAMGIKLTKTQYLQQKENNEIARKKTQTELQLQKARVNPALLFDSLDNIYQKIKTGSDDAAVMVLKLSELLSYSLYESDAEMVLLDQEISSVNDFIFLEKVSLKNTVLIDMKVIGNTSNKYIPPILLPLIQECTSLIQSDKEASNNLTIHINSEQDELRAKILFSSSARKLKPLNLAPLINKLHSRLSLLKVTESYHINIRELTNQDGFLFDLPLTETNTVKPHSLSKAPDISYDRA